MLLNLVLFIIALGVENYGALFFVSLSSLAGLIAIFTGESNE
jgi:hypothetical protein